MIPIVGVSLEEALLGFGGDDDAELHDKEVALTTSDVTGSQTAIFEYDPEDEDPQGTPPGPWDGYSLFTIDLSAVKDDIEDLQQQIADAEVCRQQVIAVLQQYDPDYDPAEGECPASKVDDLYDDYYEDEQTIADLQEQIEECDQCKADVIAKLQEYDPDFDPQTCSDIPPEIDKVVEEKSGYEFPEDTDPTDPVWLPIIGANPVKDETLDVSVFVCCYDGTNYINITKQQNPDTYSFRPAIGWNYDNNTYHWGFGDIGLNTAGDYGEIVGYTVSANGSVILHLHTHIYGWDYDDQGQYTLDWHDKYYDTIPSQAQQELAGYGDPTHTYKVKNI